MENSHHPPNEPWLIAVASSAGGIAALLTILRALPKDLPASIVVVQHRSPRPESDGFRDILERATALPVVMAEDNQIIEPGRVYVSRSDRHLTVSPTRRFEYVDGRRIRYVRSSANPLLESAAAAFDGHLVAVVLTGGGSDATDGVQTVRAHGGLVIVQDPASAEHPGMPSAAVRAGAAHLVLPLAEIGPVLDAIVRGGRINV